MTTSKSCSIRLLNKNYDITCPEAEMENLQEAAAELNAQLITNKRKFKHLDEFQNLLLAAIHVSHKLVTSQKQQEQHRHQVTQFISSLETKINQVVSGSLDLPQTD